MRGLLADPTFANALAANDVGLGFSGSGFLLIYFVGVLTSLDNKGLLSQPNLKTAGASGGALSTVAVCSNVPVSTLKDAAFNLVKSCRGNGGCSGTLDKRVRDELYSVLPSNAYSKCSNRETIAISKVTVPGPDTPLLVSSFSSNSDLVDAAAASAFIPLHSGPPGVTVTKFRGDYVYDGGFTTALPCPGGISYCIRVSAEPYGRPAGANAALYALVSAGSTLAAGVNAAANVAAGLFGAVTGGTVSTDAGNGVVAILPPPSAAAGAGGNVDIAPGKYEALQVSQQEWSSYALNPPDDSRLQYIFDLGSRDADAWWSQTGASKSSTPSTSSSAPATAPAQTTSG